MNITEFSFVAYPVTNIAKARAFYEQVLGLKASSTWGDDNQGWIEYEIGPHTLAITNMNPDAKPGGSGASVALEVADFDPAIAQLKSHGVVFDLEPITTPVCRFAVISDPDRNKLFIHKRNAG